MCEAVCTFLVTLLLKHLEKLIYFSAAGWFYKASRKADTALPSLPEVISSLKIHFLEGYCFAHSVKTFGCIKETEFQTVLQKLYFGP